MRLKALTGLALAASIAAAFCAAPAFATHSWHGWHWARTANPFTVKLGDNLSTGWKSYLGTASSDWTRSTVLDTRIVPGRAAAGCGATAGQDEICNAAYGYYGWLGIAYVWLSGLHITQGTVKLNDTYFGNPRWNNTYLRQHVICQEIGHTFGLDHQVSPTSRTCMDNQNGLSDPAFIHPNQHDYDELRIVYSHNDSSSTVAPAASAAAAQSGWASESVFIADLGGGDRLATWILWADSAASFPF
jgi:hypothetical protein